MSAATTYQDTVGSDYTVSEQKTDARWAKTRKKLLDGGRQVFADQGVEATSVLGIVRAANVLQPSF